MDCRLLLVVMHCVVTYRFYTQLLLLLFLSILKLFSLLSYQYKAKLFVTFLLQQAFLRPLFTH